MRKPRRIGALGGVRTVQVTIGGWHCLSVTEEGQANILVLLLFPAERHVCCSGTARASV